jgi:hypothetical protein
MCLWKGPAMAGTRLLDDLTNNKEILLKIKIENSDLSEIEDIFDYYMEGKFNGNNIINKKSYFKDKRQE